MRSKKEEKKREKESSHVRGEWEARAGRWR